MLRMRRRYLFSQRLEGCADGVHARPLARVREQSARLLDGSRRLPGAFTRRVRRLRGGARRLQMKALRRSASAADRLESGVDPHVHRAVVARLCRVLVRFKVRQALVTGALHWLSGFALESLGLDLAQMRVLHRPSALLLLLRAHVRVCWRGTRGFQTRVKSGHFCECARQFICVYLASVNTEAPVGEISQRPERERERERPPRINPSGDPSFRTHVTLLSLDITRVCQRARRERSVRRAEGTERAVLQETSLSEGWFDAKWCY